MTHLDDELDYDVPIAAGLLRGLLTPGQKFPGMVHVADHKSDPTPPGGANTPQHHMDTADTVIPNLIQPSKVTSPLTYLTGQRKHDGATAARFLRGFLNPGQQFPGLKNHTDQSSNMCYFLTAFQAVAQHSGALTRSLRLMSLLPTFLPGDELAHKKLDEIQLGPLDQILAKSIVMYHGAVPFGDGTAGEEYVPLTEMLLTLLQAIVVDLPYAGQHPLHAQRSFSEAHQALCDKAPWVTRLFVSQVSTTVIPTTCGHKSRHGPLPVANGYYINISVPSLDSDPAAAVPLGPLLDNYFKPVPGAVSCGNEMRAVGPDGPPDTICSERCDLAMHLLDTNVLIVLLTQAPPASTEMDTDEEKEDAAESKETENDDTAEKKLAKLLAQRDKESLAHRVTRAVTLDGWQSATRIEFVPSTIITHRRLDNGNSGHYMAYHPLTSGALLEVNTAPVRQTLILQDNDCTYTTLPPDQSLVAVVLSRVGVEGLDATYPGPGLPSLAQLNQCDWLPFPLEKLTGVLFKYDCNDPMEMAAYADSAGGPGFVHIFSQDDAMKPNTDKNEHVEKQRAPPDTSAPSSKYDPSDPAPEDSSPTISIVISNSLSDASVALAKAAHALDLQKLDLQQELCRIRAAATAPGSGAFTRAMEAKARNHLHKDMATDDGSDADGRPHQTDAADLPVDFNTLSPGACAEMCNSVLRAQHESTDFSALARSDNSASLEYRFVLVGRDELFQPFDQEDGNVNIAALKAMPFGKHLVSAYYVRTLPAFHGKPGCTPGSKACYICFPTAHHMAHAKYTAAAMYAQAIASASGLTHQSGPDSFPALEPRSVDSGGSRKAESGCVPTYMLVDKVTVKGFPFGGDATETRTLFRSALSEEIGLNELDVLMETRLDVFQPDPRKAECNLYLRIFGPRNVNYLVERLDGLTYSHDGKKYRLSATGSSPGTTLCRFCQKVGHIEKECPASGLIVRSFSRMNVSRMRHLQMLTGATRQHLGGTPGKENAKYFGVLYFADNNAQMAAGDLLAVEVRENRLASWVSSTNLGQMCLSCGITRFESNDHVKYHLAKSCPLRNPFVKPAVGDKRKPDQNSGKGTRSTQEQSVTLSAPAMAILTGRFQEMTLNTPKKPTNKTPAPTAPKSPGRSPAAKKSRGNNTSSTTSLPPRAPPERPHRTKPGDRAPAAKQPRGNGTNSATSLPPRAPAGQANRDKSADKSHVTSQTQSPSTNKSASNSPHTPRPFASRRLQFPPSPSDQTPTPLRSPGHTAAARNTVAKRMAGRKSQMPRQSPARIPASPRVFITQCRRIHEGPSCCKCTADQCRSCSCSHNCCQTRAARHIDDKKFRASTKRSEVRMNNSLAQPQPHASHGTGRGASR
jgi:hypothetical protein